jgi:putative ABC transport system permease protein
VTHGPGLLRLRPWRRGPLLLLRRPGVGLALTAAALVATLPAAAAPLFLSSARSASLHHQVANTCPSYVGAVAFSDLEFPAPPRNGEVRVLPPGTLVGSDVFRKRVAVADLAATPVRGLGPGLTTGYAEVDAVPAGRHEDGAAITLMTRTGFADHVETLDGPSGAGAWVPDRYAQSEGLHIGDTIILPSVVDPSRFESGHVPAEVREVRLPVAAIYMDLRGRPDDPWWCVVKDVYRGQPGQEFSNKPVPPMVLVDEQTFLAAGEAQYLYAHQTAEYQLTDATLTQPEARRLGADIRSMRRVMFAASDVYGSDYRNGTVFRSLIGPYADRSDLVRRSLLPPVVPITAAGVLVGLLVVAAAALFWVQRRRVELTVLAAHGIGAGGLGVKAVTEALPALGVGSLGGAAAAWALVRWAGPSPVLSAEARPLAVVLAVAALLASVLVVGVTAGVRCRTLTDQIRPHRRLGIAALPWELLLLGAALPAWRALGSGGTLVSSGESGLGAVARIPGRLLVVPIMVIAGVIALAIRLGARRLRRRALRRSPRPNSAFLAWRRIGRDAGIAATLAGATAIPIALATYGAVVTGSVHATLAAEARTIVGADVVLTLKERVPIPPAMAGHATEVLRLGGASISGVRTDVLAVDPLTFPRDAFWDARLSGRRLADLVAGLRPPDADGTVAAIGSQIAPSGLQRALWSGQPLATMDITTVPMLPAQQGGYPVVLVHRDALGADTRYAVPQLWVRGDPAQIRREAGAAHLPLTRIAGADEIYANTLFEPLTYTFDYLTALSLLTALIATVGLLLYLEGRAPLHRRAYVLLRRMGLPARAHRLALLGELAVPLSIGLFGGLALTAGFGQGLRDEFEINPSIPPPTVLAVPTGTVVLTVALVAIVALGGTGYAHRRVARANAAEVLRDTA